MKGDLNDPEGTHVAFWEGGWLRTGDIGLFDPDGYLSIVDRLKDLIITGGENVYPREVEGVLYTRNEGKDARWSGFRIESGVSVSLLSSLPSRGKRSFPRS